MTATTPLAENLIYNFARIEDDKLVKDSDHEIVFRIGGPGDDFYSFIAPIRKEYPQVHREWVVLVSYSCM